MSYSDCYSAGVAQAKLARAEQAGGGDGASHSTVQAETQLAQAERELAEIARAEQAPLFMSKQPYQPWSIRHERGAQLALQVQQARRARDQALQAAVLQGCRAAAPPAELGRPIDEDRNCVGEFGAASQVTNAGPGQHSCDALGTAVAEDEDDEDSDDDALDFIKKDHADALFKVVEEEDDDLDALDVKTWPEACSPAKASRAAQRAPRAVLALFNSASSAAKGIKALR